MISKETRKRKPLEGRMEAHSTDQGRRSTAQAEGWVSTARKKVPQRAGVEAQTSLEFIRREWAGRIKAVTLKDMRGPKPWLRKEDEIFKLLTYKSNYFPKGMQEKTSWNMTESRNERMG